MKKHFDKRVCLIGLVFLCGSAEAQDYTTFAEAKAQAWGQALGADPGGGVAGNTIVSVPGNPLYPSRVPNGYVIQTDEYTQPNWFGIGSGLGPKEIHTTVTRVVPDGNRVLVPNPQIANPIPFGFVGGYSYTGGE